MKTDIYIYIYICIICLVVGLKADWDPVTSVGDRGLRPEIGGGKLELLVALEALLLRILRSQAAQGSTISRMAGELLNQLAPRQEALRLALEPSTPNLPTKIIPTKIRWLETSWEIIYGHENSTPYD